MKCQSVHRGLIVMKLTLSVPLIWMLFSSAEALKCLQDSHGSVPQPCESDDDLCYEGILKDNDPRKPVTTLRFCASPALCNVRNLEFQMSFNVFQRFAPFSCCSTDGCNYRDYIPYYDDHQPNNLECYTDDPEMGPDLVKVKCISNQDRCIFANGTRGGKTFPVRGCVTTNVCHGPTDLKLKILVIPERSEWEDVSFSDIRCCERSLCNSAAADRLSVISLLFALAALSVC